MFPKAVSTLNSPCALPFLSVFTTLNKAASVGPNQHSATRYSTNRARAVSSGVGARMKAAQAGAARRDPTAGTHARALGIVSGLEGLVNLSET